MSTLPEIRDQCAGRWTSVLQNIGVDQKHLSGKHGPCPVCHGGKDRFRWDKKKEIAFCSQCGHKGPMDFAIAFLGRSFKETAQEIRSIIGATKMEVKSSNTEDEIEKNRSRIERIRKGLKLINGQCTASLYLANRGLKVLPESDCYFHPSMEYWQSGEKSVYPAMVAIFRNIEGKGATMHITYLTEDGKKAPVESPKKILPVILPLTGCAIRLFKSHDGFLAVAEGIETALAINQMDGVPVWACGNAANMASLEVPDDIKKLIIYADEDKTFTGVQAAYTLAKRMIAKNKNVQVMRLIERSPVLDSGDSYDFLDACVLQQYANNARM